PAAQGSETPRATPRFQLPSRVFHEPSCKLGLFVQRRIKGGRDERQAEHRARSWLLRRCGPLGEGHRRTQPSRLRLASRGREEFAAIDVSDSDTTGLISSTACTPSTAPSPGRRPTAVASVWTTGLRSFLAYKCRLNERTQDVTHKNHPRIIPSC